MTDPSPTCKLADLQTCNPANLHNLLLTEYGDHPWHPHDPVASLVLTILSQNTNDVNRDRAFERLLARFPTWEAARDAPEEELVEAIRPAGLAPTKAPRIQGALQRVTAERGEISLDFLAELPLEEARTWLLAIPGVGPKTGRHSAALCAGAARLPGGYPRPPGHAEAGADPGKDLPRKGPRFVGTTRPPRNLLSLPPQPHRARPRRLPRSQPRVRPLRLTRPLRPPRIQHPAPSTGLTSALLRYIMYGEEERAMRIGQLTEVYRPVFNGVTNFISLHKRTLESWNHKVFVFTLGDEDYEDDELYVIRSPAIPLSDTGYHLSFLFSRRARKKIKTMDVLHVHHPFLTGRQAVSMGKRYDIPVVYTNHTRYHLQASYYVPFVPEELSRVLLEAYLPDFTEQCDLVVVPSQGTARALRELGVTCHVEVIPNGVDVARFQHPPAPLSKRDLGLGDEAVVAVMVGRLGPEKNLFFLLRSFARIAGDVPDLHLVIIGDGPDKEELEEMIQLLGLASRVHLVGETPYEEMPNWLALGDFFAFPSVSESHPLAVLEALAAGLPVLGIPGPGVEDTIVDGVNGLLSPEDTIAFAAQMRRLTTEPELRTRLVARARETCGQYDIRRTSATLLAHYERLVKERARKRAENRSE